MPRGLDWERDGRDWPHRDASHFEHAAGLRWHVQMMSPPGGVAPATAVSSLPARDRRAADGSGSADAASADGRAAPPADVGSAPSGAAAGKPLPPPSGEPAAALPPLVLLIHGTGASTHSWRGLMPLLADRFTVVAVDLPGHGFTEMPPDGAFSRHFTLPGMAGALAALLRAPLLASVLPPAAPQQPVAGSAAGRAAGDTTAAAGPALVIGHSAGAAVAARMCLDGWIAPRAAVSLNGALLPLGGVAGRLFPPVAKLAAVLPFVPELFSWRASDREVLRQLVDGTGSALDAQGFTCYARLAGSAGHVAGALAMMANWDLQPLGDDLPTLRTALVLMVGSRDRTIPPEQARRVHASVPSSTLVTLDGLGHLAHEEQPARIAEAVWRVARDAGLPGAP